MEVSTLKYGPAAVRWRSPIARRQSDERLVASVRRGNHAAFTVLVKRYETRLLVFCRQMLRSREDAEDVLQEVFVAAFNAMIADDRPLNVQPWLYRIARNRSLNHLRRVKAISVDPMEMPESEAGTSTADTVHRREELRLLVGDIQKLPETQRSALVLREMEALSYDQIAEVMEKSVPSVKSLLVRARVTLAAAREGRASGKGLAALLPVAPIGLVKRFIVCHLGRSTGAGATAAGAGGAIVTGSSSGGMVVAGIGAVATKTAAGLAAAALVTAGAVAIESAPSHHHRHHHLRAARAGHNTVAAPVETARVPQVASVVSAPAAPRQAGRPILPAPEAAPASPAARGVSQLPAHKASTTVASAATPSPAAQPAKVSAQQDVKSKPSTAASGGATKMTTDASRARTTVGTSTTSSSSTSVTTTETTTTASNTTTTTSTSTASTSTASDTTTSADSTTDASTTNAPNADPSTETISAPAAVTGEAAQPAGALRPRKRPRRRWYHSGL